MQISFFDGESKFKVDDVVCELIGDNYGEFV